jgi:hypothetical protein
MTTVRPHALAARVPVRGRGTVRRRSRRLGIRAADELAPDRCGSTRQGAELGRTPAVDWDITQMDAELPEVAFRVGHDRLA